MKLCVLVIIFVLILHETIGEPACASMSVIRNFEVGQRFNNALNYLTVYHLTPVKCVETCMRSSVCKSVNFNTSRGECQLYHRSSEKYNITEADDFILTDVKDWSLNIAGDCSNHTCPNNTICVPDPSEIYSCVLVGCLWTSDLENFLPTHQPMWQFGLQLHDFCLEGFYSISPAVCKSNGKWHVPRCRRVASSCEKLKSCNSSYGDGEYWLYHVNSRRSMKIYCHNMTSSNPLEFITLHYSNMASRSIHEYDEGEKCTKKLINDQKIKNKNLGETTFFKVHINVYQLKMRKSTFIFSNSTSEDGIDYGMAFACSGSVNSSCPALGRFVVDLRNTSFSVLSTSQWSKFATLSSYIEDIKLSFGNQVVEGTCGGSCGGCIYTDTVVEINHNSNLDLNSAVHPDCST